ncbi:MAG: hypothetical protein GY797_38440 [Deltaproteobacteria bacterium]|nr:hypothetical protein [Deltaproteobacteria bacterium]
MAKMTEEQKAEMAKLKAIPNDKMKASIASMNTFLGTIVMDAMPKAKSKGEAVKLFTDAVQGLVDNDMAEEIPEDVATFFNDFIVGGDDAGDDAGAEAGGDTEKADEKPKAKKPRKTKAEIQARYDAIADMIKTGKHTKKEIIDTIAPKFPDVTVSTISTFVQDCMNEKYNKLPKLTVKGEDGKLSFKK